LKLNFVAVDAAAAGVPAFVVEELAVELADPHALTKSADARVTPNNLIFRPNLVPPWTFTNLSTISHHKTNNEHSTKYHFQQQLLYHAKIRQDFLLGRINLPLRI
jgi:hypothetical protein